MNSSVAVVHCGKSLLLLSSEDKRKADMKLKLIFNFQIKRLHVVRKLKTLVQRGCS